MKKHKNWQPPATEFMGIPIPEELQACGECGGDLGAMRGRQYYMRQTEKGEDRICEHCFKEAQRTPIGSAKL